MTTALEGGGGSASRPGRYLAPRKTWYPLYRRLGGPQSRSGQLRRISPPPGFDPRTVQLVASRYTDCATRPTKYFVRDTKHKLVFRPTQSFVPVPAVIWQMLSIMCRTKRMFGFLTIPTRGTHPAHQILLDFCRSNITCSRFRQQCGLSRGVCGRSLAGISGSNSAECMDVFLLWLLHKNHKRITSIIVR